MDVVGVVGGCGGFFFFFFSAVVCGCGGFDWWLVVAMVGGYGGCGMGEWMWWPTVLGWESERQREGGRIKNE